MISSIPDSLIFSICHSINVLFSHGISALIEPIREEIPAANNIEVIEVFCVNFFL